MSRVLYRDWLPARPAGQTVQWLTAGAYFAVYLALEWARFVHIHKGVPVTPWDTALGVIFALMMRGGALGGFILFGGMLIAEELVLPDEVEWPITIGIAAITALSYAGVAAAARRVLVIDTELTRLRDVLLLLA